MAVAIISRLDASEYRKGFKWILVRDCGGLRIFIPGFSHTFSIQAAHIFLPDLWVKHDAAH